MKRFSESSEESESYKKPKEEFQLVLHRKVGEGIYGKVFEAQFAESSKWRAVKVLKQDEDDTFCSVMPPTIRELLVGGTCSGLARSGVIRFSSQSAFPGQYGVVTDLGHCSLQNIAPSTIPLHAVRVFGKALLQRIHEMHSKGAMHRDLKPDNVLLAWSGEDVWPSLQIIDYGLSSPCLRSTDENVVTLWWRAPEVMLGLEHTKSLDIWAFGVIMANLCSKDKITEAVTVEGALYDVWEKLGYPSQEQWRCPRPPFKGETKGMQVLDSHVSILRILRFSLLANPAQRCTASELLLDPFWSEIPTLEQHTAAQDWILSKRDLWRRDPIASTRYMFSAHQVHISYSLDSTLAESDAVWISKAMEAIKQEHVEAIKLIAVKARWPMQASELCAMIVDRSLQGGAFTALDAASLACSAAYVTSCLYADCEPSPFILKRWTNAMDEIASIERGVHTVLQALKFRLIPADVIMKVKMSGQWEQVAAWLK